MIWDFIRMIFKSTSQIALILTKRTLILWRKWLFLLLQRLNDWWIECDKWISFYNFFWKIKYRPGLLIHSPLSMIFSFSKCIWPKWLERLHVLYLYDWLYYSFYYPKQKKILLDHFKVTKLIFLHCLIFGQKFLFVINKSKTQTYVSWVLRNLSKRKKKIN